MLFAAFVGAGAGILAQPLAAALDRAGGLVPGAMGLAVVGLLGAAWAAQAQSLVLVLVDSALLGAAYGVCRYCGLLAATTVATPATRPSSRPPWPGRPARRRTRRRAWLASRRARR